MEFLSGPDVSIDETAICVVDDKGTVHLQTSVATDAEAILQALKPFLPRLRRVGHEAGSLSPWHPELKALGIPSVCLETHHGRAAMSAQRNKTDAADALGLAHIVRTGWFKAAFIKSEPGYRMRLLLTQRRNLKRKFLDIENSIRHSLKAFGIRFKNTAASALLTRFRGKDKVKTWGLMLAKRGCHHKAAVAVARKLAVIMHAMWSDGTVYIGDPAVSETDVSARAVVKDRKLLGAHA